MSTNRHDPRATEGLHHVTAIAGDPRRNLDFYTEVMGLSLVKRTVNFDDPGTYHFYFGDETGSPGSILTFFPIPGAPRGSRGPGQVTATSFEVPAASLDAWRARLESHGLVVGDPVRRFGEQVLTFLDPDGLELELVGVAASGNDRRASDRGPVAGGAIAGFHGVTLAVADAGPSEAFLTRGLGYRLEGREGNRRRFAAAGGGPGRWLDLVEVPGDSRGRVAVGTVHHVAFRVADAETQELWRGELAAEGVHPTPVQERMYFRSIYFREPGGVLFEVATDGPGFAVDEPSGELGERLTLPAWLEADRRRIEAALPALEWVQGSRAEVAAGAVEAGRS